MNAAVSRADESSSTLPLDISDDNAAVSRADEASSTFVELPFDILDDFVRLGGWRRWGQTWSKVCKRYHPLEWWRREGEPNDNAQIVVVPDDATSIKTAIARASHHAETGQRAVVLVRPGIYREAIRVTADISVCALGPRGGATIHAPGWEPALAWGGFKVGVTHMGRVTLKAASAGASSDVCGLSLVQRNQSQMTAVYCTFGSPVIAHCDIVGSVRIAGRAASPVLLDCHVSQSRSVGLDFMDHASGKLDKCSVRDNRLAAVRLARTATPSVSVESNVFLGNGYDGIRVRGAASRNKELVKELEAEEGEGGADSSAADDDDESDDCVDGEMWRSEGATDSRDVARHCSCTSEE